MIESHTRGQQRTLNRVGITVKWDDSEQTILLMEYKGHWTVEELREIGTDAILMIRTVQHPVYVVSDFTESAGVPIGVLWQARDLNQLRPPNWEAGITITGDALARNLLDLFGHVYLGARRMRLHAVGSRAEAERLITCLKDERRTP